MEEWIYFFVSLAKTKIFFRRLCAVTSLLINSAFTVMLIEIVEILCSLIASILFLWFIWQLLLLGGHANEAIVVLEQFCNESSSVLSLRLRSCPLNDISSIEMHSDK